MPHRSSSRIGLDAVLAVSEKLRVVSVRATAAEWGMEPRSIVMGVIVVIAIAISNRESPACLRRFHQCRLCAL